MDKEKLYTIMEEVEHVFRTISWLNSEINSLNTKISASKESSDALDQVEAMTSDLKNKNEQKADYQKKLSKIFKELIDELGSHHDQTIELESPRPNCPGFILKYKSATNTLNWDRDEN